MIRTVTGDIEAQALGHTQCHEHLYIAKGPSYDVNPALYMDDRGKSCAELAGYKAAGGGTVVDAQPAYCGRMAGALTKASLYTGVNIVAVTGFHKLCFAEPDCFLETATEAQLRDFFIREVTVGMICEDGSVGSARAGLIKVAADDSAGYDAPVYAKLYNAAAAAAIECGAPVIFHTEKSRDALDRLRFFEAAGLPTERVIVCHLDRTRYDAAYHKEVAAAGAYLCYDSVNRLKYLSHEQEIALICEMIAAGYTDKLLLSLDTTNQRLAAYGADMGLDYILTTFIPMLEAHGVPKEAVAAMTKVNAGSALSLR